MLSCQTSQLHSSLLRVGDRPVSYIPAMTTSKWASVQLAAAPAGAEPSNFASNVHPSNLNSTPTAAQQRGASDSSSHDTRSSRTPLQVAFLVPNIICYLRLGLLVVAWGLAASGRHPPAALGAYLACFVLDSVDGMLARRLNQVWVPGLAAVLSVTHASGMPSYPSIAAREMIWVEHDQARAGCTQLLVAAVGHEMHRALLWRCTSVVPHSAHHPGRGPDSV
jgi:hypothetical protein